MFINHYWPQFQKLIQIKLLSLEQILTPFLNEFKPQSEFFNIDFENQVYQKKGRRKREQKWGVMGSMH